LPAAAVVSQSSGAVATRLAVGPAEPGSSPTGSPRGYRWSPACGPIGARAPNRRRPDAPATRRHPRPATCNQRGCVPAVQAWADASPTGRLRADGLGQSPDGAAGRRWRCGWLTEVAPAHCDRHLVPLIVGRGQSDRQSGTFRHSRAALEVLKERHERLSMARQIRLRGAPIGGGRTRALIIGLTNGSRGLKSVLGSKEDGP